MRSIFIIALLMIAALLCVTGQARADEKALGQAPGEAAEPVNEDPYWSKGWTNIVPANHTGQTFIARNSILSSVEVAVMTTINTQLKLITTLSIQDGQVKRQHE